MKKSIDNYIKEIDEKIDKSNNLEELKQEHLTKISFYQHERLIHLLVTLFYGLFLFITVILSFFNPLGLLIVLIFMIFLIFYVKYYFYLENHVQYMYKQYDRIVERQKNKKK